MSEGNQVAASGRNKAPTPGDDQAPTTPSPEEIAAAAGAGNPGGIVGTGDGGTADPKVAALQAELDEALAKLAQTQADLDESEDELAAARIERADREESAGTFVISRNALGEIVGPKTKHKAIKEPAAKAED